VSGVLALLATLPRVVLFWTTSEPLIRLIGTGDAAIRYGTRYLRVASLAMPFAALNLIGSRALIGADDAWTPMVVRAGTAVANVAINAVLIFVFDLGVVGAAVGTVLGTIAGTVLFGWGLTTGRLPFLGSLPICIDWSAPHWRAADARHLIRVSSPLALRKIAQSGGQFPMLAILGLFGPTVVAAYVVALRVRALMNTPGWGFGLASSSLVGQALGQNNEREAEAYGRDIIRFAVATYFVSALIVAVSAEQLVQLFADSPSSPEIPIARDLVYAACFAIIFQGVSGASAGPLDASGDTRIPFVSQFIGQYLGSIPLAYLGAGGDIPAITVPVVGVTTPEVVLPTLGLWGLYLAFVSETAIPAAINYWRFRTNKWMRISQAYRPDAAGADEATDG